MLACLGDLEPHLFSIPQNIFDTCANLEVLIVPLHYIQTKGLPRISELSIESSLESACVYLHQHKDYNKSL